MFLLLIQGASRFSHRRLFGGYRTVTPEEQVHAERIRARLLGCLEKSLLRDSARQLQERLASKNAIPKNKSYSMSLEITSGTYSTKDGWEDPVDEPSNREILRAIEPVEAFSSQLSAPSEDEVASVFTALEVLYALLTDGAKRHQVAVDSGWSHLAWACKRIAHWSGLRCDRKFGIKTRQFLIECSTKRKPEFDEEWEKSFEKITSWGSPAARIDAAAGLLILAERETCVSEEVLATIGTLSHDQVSAVRFQVASNLLALYATNLDFMWSLAEKIAERDSSVSVLNTRLNSVLGQLAGAQPDRVFDLVKVILHRTADREAGELRRDAHSLVEGLYVYRGHAPSEALVREVVNAMHEHPSDARDLVGPLRSAIIYGSNQEEDTQVRQRALALMLELLQRAQTGLDSITQSQSGVPWTEWEQSAQKTAQKLAQLVNDVCSQVYFASGAFELGQGGKDAAEAPSVEIRIRLYNEASELLDQLVGVSLPEGIHHVISTLEIYIDHEPKDVFLRIARTVRKNVQSGYQNESLAEALIVRIVQRYLADHRSMLREEDACRTALIELLETFVRAGWPSARQLTYRLEEIFR